MTLLGRICQMAKSELAREQEPKSENTNYRCVVCTSAYTNAVQLSRFVVQPVNNSWPVSLTTLNWTSMTGANLSGGRLKMFPLPKRLNKYFRVPVPSVWYRGVA